MAIIIMRSCVLLCFLMVTMPLFPAITAFDGDGDGVNDEFDICPFAAGTANTTVGMGCPDSDGDGIANFEQAVMFDWSNSKTLDVSTNSMGGEKTSLAWAPNNTVFFVASKNNDVSMFDKSGNFVTKIHN